MHPTRRIVRVWLAAALAAILLSVPFTQVQHASAADGSLVIAALRALQRYYIDPVQPVPLLNAAIATLRQATHAGPDLLPDIPAGTPENQASVQFTTEFSRAAQTGVMPATPLAYAATEGMLDSLHDSHTHYLSPQMLREERQQLFGNPVFTGIGVTITQRKDTAGTGWIFVEDVFPGSPAAGADVRRFDRIIQVDGKSLENMSTLDASQLIRGPAGSTVQLVITRGSQTLRIPVVRGSIRVPPVEGRWLRPGTAYVKLFQFSEGAGREVRSALERLSTEGTIRSVVLDLRGNSGGLILEASSVGGIFLPPRTVLSRITERGHEPSTLMTTGVPLMARTPLVVLVDGLSASAAEILTGAFKDYQRGAIVGEKTAGALGGAVTVSLPEGGMSVTVERILTPKNEQVEGVGIQPDVPVPLTVADMERGQDVQLEAALHALGQAWVSFFHVAA
jgi:carboxyl-terminal processing protease